MLILSRRLGETIIVDGSIRVRVMAITNGQVRVGIEAPASVRVDRLEIHERRCAEDYEALSGENIW